MKVDPRAVLGIRAKIERAHTHFITLGNEFRAFDERKPYRLDAEVQADGAKHIRRLRVTEPIPVMWSVILGEAVHDLRSALDQAIYWLTVDWTGTELGTSTAFPIFTRRRRVGREPGFADTSPKHPEGKPGSGLHMIRGVGPGPRAFIERVQPYPQRNGPLPKALLALRDFWNQDKHRLVNLFGVLFLNGDTTISGAPVGTHVNFRVIPRLHYDGAIAMLITCDPPTPHLEVHGDVQIAMAVKSPGRHRRSAQASLMDMCIDTALVCMHLIEAIGHQDEPISMGAFEPRPDGVFADLLP